MNKKILFVLAAARGPGLAALIAGQAVPKSGCPS